MKETKTVSGNARNLNLDLIRAVAAMSVLCVHFFLNTEFYQTAVFGKRMYVMVFMRTTFMVCVPLFILLTGYLMSHKELSRGYYRGILKTLEMYLVVGIFCYVFRFLILQEAVTPAGIIKGLLSFKASEYGWYVEMYLGLYLLIPFLNILYHGLQTRRRKQVLLMTLLAIFTLPTVTNIWGMQILPNWWNRMWPLMYYFAGGYIREYRPRMPKRYNVLLLAGVLLGSSLFIIWRCHGKAFEWGTYNDWFGWQNTASSLLLFMLLLDLNLSRVPRIFCRLISWTARLSLGIYLSSWMADSWFYPLLNSHVPQMVMRLNYFPITVLIIFTCSAASSWLAEFVMTVCNRLVIRQAAKED